MKTYSVLNLLAFTCFLVIGYTFSLRFYQPGDFISAPDVDAAALAQQDAIKTMDDGQRSLLLISTSSLDASSQHLEGVWLVSYLLPDTTIHLLPIYPSGSQTVSDFEQQVDRYFKLNRQGSKLELDQGFVSLLESHNYWWSGYIIYDEVSLTKFITLLEGIELNGHSLAGVEVIDKLQGSSNSPQDAYSTQMAVFQSVCHKFALDTDTPGFDVSQLISLIPNHILTDLQPEQLQKEISLLYSTGHSPTCRFPTLEVSQINLDVSAPSTIQAYVR